MTKYIYICVCVNCSTIFVITFFINIHAYSIIIIGFFYTFLTIVSSLHTVVFFNYDKFMQILICTTITI